MSFKILLVGSTSENGLNFHFTRLALTIKKMENEIIVFSSRREQYSNLSTQLNNFGIRHYVSNDVDKLSPINVINGTIDIKKILKKESGFNIIHAGGIKHGIKVFFATRSFNIKPKTFATILYLPKMGVNGIIKLYKLFYDKYIALCNFSKNQLIKFGINHKNIYVIPLFAPDLEWFDGVKKNKINLEKYKLQNIDKPVIFYAAKHFIHKGFPYYLLAASKILKKFDATFVIGGIGPLTYQLQKFAEKLGISNHVVFSGWISHYHMPYLLCNIIDICVSTSIEEQLPSYIMECMAGGKPVVASRVGGVSEIVNGGVNGYLVPSYDFEKTARYIMNLLDNSKKSRKMGLAGRNMIETKYNMKNSVKKLLNVYEESLRG